MRTVKSRRLLIPVTVLALTVAGAWLARAQNPPAGRLLPPSSSPAPAPAPIALVGGRSISRDEFKAREAEAMSSYRQRLGQDVPEQAKPVVRRQLLESLIRRELLVLEAGKRGVLGTDAEAEAQLKQEPFFNPDGKFDQRRLDAVRTTQPENWSRAVQQLKLQLGAQKLANQLEKEYAGDASHLKTAVERNLGSATFEVLALNGNEFDGGYREPRELEVVDAWRRTPDAWRRPAEGKLTLLVVDQPPLAGDADAAARDRWTARMRQRADSAAGALQHGAAIEDVAREVGSLHRDVTVTPDNFPGYWKGDAKDAAAVFAAKAGTIVPTPVANERGWLVVRVDALTPAHVAPLREVAREVRAGLRKEARLHGQDRELRALYDAKKGEQRMEAWKVRWAAFDTSMAMGDPSPAELDRWYRAHQADFSSFDASSGSIKIRPLAEVREVATTRWKAERRRDAARIGAATLEESWKRGRRGGDAEKGVMVKETGPLVTGAPVDDSPAGRTLADTLARRPWDLRVAVIPYASGWVAYQVYERVPNYVPTFEQMRVELAQEYSNQRTEEEEKGARALYDKDPSAFAAKNVINYTRVLLPRLNPLTVPLTRARVEKYYREHLDRYSAAEIVRARHILVKPQGDGPDALDRARAKAQELLERARGGEDFAELARRYSDDLPTRASGGDLGEFGRGAMLPEIEEVVFRLQPGEVGDLVHTEEGFHILYCVSHAPVFIQELRHIYANVGWDAATEMMDSLAIRQADSLAAAVKTPAQARAAAAKFGARLDPTYHETGDRRALPDLVSFYIRLERTRPGQVVPGRGYDRSIGHFIAWVDSISPERTRSWDDARSNAIDLYRRGAAERALTAKRAEIDSLMAQGWSADSVAALWGGWQKVEDGSPGANLAGLGRSDAADSVIFGTRTHAPVLKQGQLSSWIDMPGGTARVRLVERGAVDATRVAATVESERRIHVEQKLDAYFDGLKKRYPVKILDERLRDTPLPPPPTSKLEN